MSKVAATHVKVYVEKCLSDSLTPGTGERHVVQNKKKLKNSWKLEILRENALYFRHEWIINSIKLSVLTLELLFWMA